MLAPRLPQTSQVDLGGVDLDTDQVFDILLDVDIDVDRRGRDHIAPNAAFWDDRHVFVEGVKSSLVGFAPSNIS